MNFSCKSSQKDNNCKVVTKTLVSMDKISSNVPIICY